MILILTSPGHTRTSGGKEYSVAGGGSEEKGEGIWKSDPVHKS